MQFSIIIPAKNEQANIGRCIDSILSVDWDKSRYEIIVIDNGSTDQTVEIARGKGASVHVKPECTISGLRNFGARLATGDILVFLDADCTVDRSWLSESSRYLSQKEIACFGSPPRVPDHSTWVQRAWFQVRLKKEPVGETEWLESMNMFIRGEAFALCGGFNESLVTCEDYDISLRLKAFGKVVADSRIIAVHHGEASTAAHFFRKELWRGISNIKGIFHHGVKLVELPSIGIPVLHCTVLLALIMSLLFRYMTALDLVAYTLAVFAGWQLLLLTMSFLKYRKNGSSVVVQIFMLLNIYYLARGAAFVKR
jgi:glycosyltransferase involved in cell wall biosynthesis